jgi:hypothetical protein
LSFARSFEEAKSIIHSIQMHKVDGASEGYSSPILNGTEDTGVTVAHPDNQLKLRRTSEAHVAQTTLRRKYASTGSGGGKESGVGLGHGRKK